MLSIGRPTDDGHSVLQRDLNEIRGHEIETGGRVGPHVIRDVATVGRIVNERTSQVAPRALDEPRADLVLRELGEAPDGRIVVQRHAAGRRYPGREVDALGESAPLSGRRLAVDQAPAREEL